MKAGKQYVVVLVGLVIVGLATVLPAGKASAPGGESQFIAESSLLAGLAPGAVFPFIDTTPHDIAQAHIAITDSTSDCHPGAAAPDNIKILVGQAGAARVAVIAKRPNTSIFTPPGQRVFQ